MFPIYFKAIAQVPAMQVLAHRVVWSLLFLGIVLAAGGGWSIVRRAMRAPGLLRLLALSSCAIAVNWGVFVWAVAQDRVLECSLGYFATPLLSITLGVLVLGERLHPMQWAAVALAAAGVMYQTLVFGVVPWVALVLALSFAGYALLRKISPIETIDGLFIEALLLTPVALGYLLLVRGGGQRRLWRWRLAARRRAGVERSSDGATVDPVCRRRPAYPAGDRGPAAIHHAVRPIPSRGARLRRSFSPSSVVVFACIWAGLAIYSLDALRRSA